MLNKADIDPSYCNNVVLRQAARRLGQLYDDLIAPSGLRATQHGLLAYVAHLGEPTVSELAEALVMDLSALGHTLKPLIRDGFIETVRDQRDRRAKRVRLTAHGETTLVEALRQWQHAQDSFEAAFGVEKAAELRATLAYLASPEFNDIFLRKQAERRR